MGWQKVELGEDALKVLQALQKVEHKLASVDMAN
jgi:hypothetical protein